MTYGKQKQKSTFLICTVIVIIVRSKEQDIEQINKNREMNDMRREYLEEKLYKFEEMWECGRRGSFKTDDKIKNRVRAHFPYKRFFKSRLPISKKRRWIPFWLRSG